MISEAVILAGGRGTRLLPVVSDRPKPMAVVDDRPFLEWLILALRLQGVRRAVLAAGHMGEAIERHFRGRDLGLEILVSHERTPLGTGGAARNALPLLSGDVIAVLNGDSYCPFALPELAAARERAGADGCVWLVEVPDGRRYGSVRLDAHGRVEAFDEKAAAGPALINAGVYALRRDVLLGLIPPGGPMSMEREVLPVLSRKGALHGVVGAGPFLDIGTPESYRAATALLGSQFKMLSKAA